MSSVYTNGIPGQYYASTQSNTPSFIAIGPNGRVIGIGQPIQRQPLMIQRQPLMIQRQVSYDQVPQQQVFQQQVHNEPVEEYTVTDSSGRSVTIRIRHL